MTMRALMRRRGPILSLVVGIASGQLACAEPTRAKWLLQRHTSFADVPTAPTASREDGKTAVSGDVRGCLSDLVYWVRWTPADTEQRPIRVRVAKDGSYDLLTVAHGAGSLTVEANLSDSRTLGPGFRLFSAARDVAEALPTATWPIDLPNHRRVTLHAESTDGKRLGASFWILTEAGSARYLLHYKEIEIVLATGRHLLFAAAAGHLSTATVLRIADQPAEQDGDQALVLEAGDRPRMLVVDRDDRLVRTSSLHITEYLGFPIDPDQGSPLMVSTNGDGRADDFPVEPGTYSLEIRAPGAPTVRVTVDLPAPDDLLRLPASLRFR